jgi:hypothetical protein
VAGGFPHQNSRVRANDLNQTVAARRLKGGPASAGPPALLLLERACGRRWRKSHDLSRRSRPILRSLAEAMWLEATPMSHALRRRAAHYGETGRRDACLPVGCA